MGALLLDSNERVLLGRKDAKDGGVYSECWHAPGGGIEEGEARLQALQRELQEEIGILVEASFCELLDETGTGSANKRLASGEVVRVQMRFSMYVIHVTDELKLQVTPRSEFQELRWFERAELAAIPLTPPGTALFRKLGWLTTPNPT